MTRVMNTEGLTIFLGSSMEKPLTEAQVRFMIQRNLVTLPQLKVTHHGNFAQIAEALSSLISKRQRD